MYNNIIIVVVAIAICKVRSSFHNLTYRLHPNNKLHFKTMT